MYRAIALPLTIVGKSALRACAWDPGCDPYNAEARAAARALERAEGLAGRILKGKPAHSRTARIVRSALETARWVIDGLASGIDAGDLDSAGKATLRAAERVAAIDAALTGQPTEPAHKLVVLQSVKPELLDVADSLEAAHVGEPVQDQGRDETAPVSALSATD